MSITCTWTFALQPGNEGADIADAVDAVMAALVAREDAALHDCAIGLDLAAMTAEISVCVDALDHERAVASAAAFIREAIQATGADVVEPAFMPSSRLLCFRPERVVAA